MIDYKNTCLIIGIIIISGISFLIGYSLNTNKAGRYYFSNGNLYDTSTGDFYERIEYNNREIILKYNRATGKSEKIEIKK